MSAAYLIWPAFAGATFMLAMIHFMVWLKRRRALANLAIAFLAISTAASAACELWIMGSGEIGRISAAVRWYHVPLAAIFVSLVFFARVYLAAGRRWLAWAVIALRMIGLALNFLVGPNINFREITGIKTVPFLGGPVSVMIGIPNPLMIIMQLSTFLLAVFVADAMVTMWRRGDRRLALAVGGSTLFFVIVGFVHSALVIWQITPMPIVVSIFWVGVTAALGYETTEAALKAGVLADSLRESEARYRGILERSSEAIYRTTPEGRILFANPATARILGYDSPEDLIGSVTDVPTQVWADPQARSRFVRKVDEGGAVQGHECRFRRKDGALIWVSLSSSPVRGPDGRILHFDGMFTNIDERKRVEEALQKSRRLLEEMGRIGNVGGWEIDLDTMKLTWTAEIYNIHEVDPSYEPTLERSLGFYPPASRPIITRLVQRAIEKGEPFDADLELVTARGRTVNVHTTGRADLEHHRVFGFFQDITARVKDEQEKAELRNELFHLSRVLIVDEISTSLAHEINQPLGAILNNAEAARTLLNSGGLPEGDSREIIEDIIRDVTRAGEVVRKVRGVLKKEEPRFGRLSVNALIDETLRILRNNLALNDVALHLEMGRDLPDVRGDRVRLQQVLLNLAANAQDAMSASSSKTLTVHSAMADPETVVVTVVDSGPGIPESRRESVFLPFVSTKKDGLGLGLPICRSIVEEHGGRIWVENDPSGGAAFSFSLKAWRDKPA